MSVQVFEFDRSLIGVPLKRGYRIKLNPKEYKYLDILNYLSNKYGEGSFNQQTEHIISLANKWTLFNNIKHVDPDKRSIFVCLATHEMLEDFCEKFNVPYTIDNTKTTESIIKRIVEKFYHEPRNWKVSRRLREQLRKALYIGVNNIQYSKDLTKMFIQVDDKYYVIDLEF